LNAGPRIIDVAPTLPVYGQAVRTAPLLLALLMALAAALPAAAFGRERLDTRVFARVGLPGYPEPVAIGPDGLVYVGTNRSSVGRDANADLPSQVLVHDHGGRLVRRERIRGQDLSREHGIQGLAFDGSGLLYALDRSAVRPRVIVIDPGTGRQRDYATFADVPPCGPTRRTNCSAGSADRPAGPDYATFARDGSLYVTDIDQALIWKVPRGGGRARVWFTDPLLDNPFGPNGIQFHRDGRTLRFAQTISGDPSDGGAGLLLDVAVKRDGRPGRLRRFWRSRPGDAVDGFAIARSGNVYVALALGDALALVSPARAEVTRYPATREANARLPVPYDGPASLAFQGRRLLVSNQSSVRSNPSSWAVFDVWAGERGIPLFRPVIAPPARRPKIRLTVTVRAGTSSRFRRVAFVVTVGRGARRRAVRGARITLAGRAVESDRFGRASLRVPVQLLAHARARATARGLRARVSRVKT
jgi:sugar lactone lactonase YvrE